jgi:hypothetical protein
VRRELRRETETRSRDRDSTPRSTLVNQVVGVMKAQLIYFLQHIYFCFLLHLSTKHRLICQTFLYSRLRRRTILSRPFPHLAQGHSTDKIQIWHLDGLNILPEFHKWHSSLPGSPETHVLAASAKDIPRLLCNANRAPSSPSPHLSRIAKSSWGRLQYFGRSSRVKSL